MRETLEIRRPKAGFVYSDAPTAGCWVTADGRFSIFRPICGPPDNVQHQRYWHIGIGDNPENEESDLELLALNGLSYLTDSGAKFATRREALSHLLQAAYSDQ